jgi:tetratricopeptide (TPR) repeat protein
MSGGTLDSESAEASGGKSRWLHPAVLAVVCALILGVYGWSARSGVMELRELQAADTYYNLLVQGFRAGQLNLKREVPPGLAQLANPYDPTANRDYRLGGRYPPLHDLSYYKGKLYLYFGVTPVLLLFWPYTALTDDFLLHKDAVLIFCAVGFLVSVGLLYALWRRYFATVSFGAVVAGAVALGLVPFTPLLLSRSDVYEVSISCGYALTMLALAAIWRALHVPARRGRWLAAASLAYGLALGARPSLLSGAVILLVPVVQAWRERRQMAVALLAATGPIVLIGLGLMVYNLLRFDNPLEFGLRYELSTYGENTQQHFSLSYLWFNFRVFFLAPAHWGGRFPFVHDIVVPPLPEGYVEVLHAFGVLANIPLVWLGLAAPLAWRDRSVETGSALRWFLAAVTLLFGTGALTMGLHNSACIRYELEFAQPLVLLAVMGILGLERTLAGWPVWRWATRWGWGLALAFSVAFNLLESVDRQAEADDLQGRLFFHRGQVDEAIARFYRSLKLRPGDATTHTGLGVALLQKGQLDEANAHFRKALESQPDLPEAQVSLGSLLASQDRWAEAIEHLQKALELKPDFTEAYHSLGNALAAQGRTAEAIEHYRKALKIRPGYIAARYRLSNALLQCGQEEEAIAHFQKTLELQPKHIGALNNLAWALATCPEASLRDGNKAIELAQQANLFSNGRNPEILDTLAVAYAEGGQFSNAVAIAQQALELAAAQNNTNLADALREEIKLYQANQPFHRTSSGP